MVKGKTLSRARATPRQIRDIRPARQLPRSEPSQEDENDDWWFRSGGNGRGGSGYGSPNRDPSSAAEQHMQRVAAANGARVRFGRNNTMGADEAAGSDSNEYHGHAQGHRKGIRGNLAFVFRWLLLDMMWNKFMALPTQKKLKRIIACMILFSTWRTIYFADLDYHSKPKWESSFFNNYKGSSSSSGVTVKSMGKELSSLALSGKDPFDSDSGDLSLGKKLVQEEMRLDSGASDTESLYDTATRSADGKKNTSGQPMSQNLQGSNTRIMSNVVDTNIVGPGYATKTLGGMGGDSGSRNDDWFGDGGISPSKGESGASPLEVPMPAGQKIQHYQPQYQSLQAQSNLQPSNSLQFGISQSNSFSNPQHQQSPNLHAQQPPFQQQSKLQNSNIIQSGMYQSNLAPQSHFSSGVQQSNPQTASRMQQGTSRQQMMAWPDTQSQQQNQQPQYSSFQQQQSALSNGNGMQPGMTQSKMMSWSDSQQYQQPHQPLAYDGNFMQSNPLGPMQSKRMPLPYSPPQQQIDPKSYSLTQQNGNTVQGQYQLNSSSQLHQQQYHGLRGSDVTYSDSMQAKFDSWVSQNNKPQGGGMRHSHAELNCSRHGGPHFKEEVSEIIYWRDIPSDAFFVSPFYLKDNKKSFEEISNPPISNRKPKYLTFEMDGSGWNNIRMGFENLILLAHAMARTLVLPPKRQIFHMADKSAGRVFSLDDFYDINLINKEQMGLNIITMEEFLKREALSGNLKSLETGESTYPPSNLTQWDNQRLNPLWSYLRRVAKSFEIWEPTQCVMAFPALGSDIRSVATLMHNILVGADGRTFPRPNDFQGAPTRVDAPPTERLREILAERRKICMYDDNMHADYSVVHFKAEEDGTRLITDFYTFLYFEDWRQDLWSKRFIRDHLRYKDEIMCVAARVINAVREHAKSRSSSNIEGLYNAMHIRRKDFQSQFPVTMMTASDILSEIQTLIAANSTLFIATDEKDRSFFEPLARVYDVCYLGDFAGAMGDINPNFLPLVEQLVASRSRIFVGTYFSTFSNLIVRLRGYFSVKEKRIGYLKGELKDTFYLPSLFKNKMQMYGAIRQPFFAQAFPVAWRGIDYYN